MTKAFVRTYRFSKTFRAPVRFVYSWCTDYQEDDMEMTGSTRKRHILEKTKEMVLWRIEGKGVKKGFDPIRIIWLHPPNSWHLVSAGDETEVGDYKLTPLGTKKTRLDMTFMTTYYDRKSIVSARTYKRDALAHWKGYGQHLERDYRASLK